MYVSIYLTNYLSTYHLLSSYLESSIQRISEKDRILREKKIEHNLSAVIKEEHLTCVCPNETNSIHAIHAWHTRAVSFVKAYECVYSMLSTFSTSSNRDYFTEPLHLGLVYLFPNETVIKSLISNASHTVHDKIMGSCCRVGN